MVLRMVTPIYGNFDSRNNPNLKYESL